MMDLLTAIGLMFVLEGAAYALFPDAMKRMISHVLMMQPSQIRIAGVAFAVFGFLIVGVLRGF